jgi:hypothetical protein
VRLKELMEGLADIEHTNGEVKSTLRSLRLWNARSRLPQPALPSTERRCPRRCFLGSFSLACSGLCADLARGHKHLYRTRRFWAI